MAHLLLHLLLDPLPVLLLPPLPRPRPLPYPPQPQLRPQARHRLPRQVLCLLRRRAPRPRQPQHPLRDLLRHPPLPWQPAGRCTTASTTARRTPTSIRSHTSHGNGLAATGSIAQASHMGRCRGRRYRCLLALVR